VVVRCEHSTAAKAILGAVGVGPLFSVSGVLLRCVIENRPFAVLEELNLLEKSRRRLAPGIAPLSLSRAFMWAIIASALSNGPKVRPALMSAKPSARRASIRRRCPEVYSSFAAGGFGRMVITPPDTLNSRSWPFLWPAFRRTDGGTTRGILVLFVTVTVMGVKAQPRGRVPGNSERQAKPPAPPLLSRLGNMRADLPKNGHGAVRSDQNDQEFSAHHGLLARDSLTGSALGSLSCQSVPCQWRWCATKPTGFKKTTGFLSRGMEL
jgi:hypothetical protein